MWTATCRLPRVSHVNCHMWSVTCDKAIVRTVYAIDQLLTLSIESKNSLDSNIHSSTVVLLKHNLYRMEGGKKITYQVVRGGRSSKSVLTAATLVGW